MQEWIPARPSDTVDPQVGRPLPCLDNAEASREKMSEAGRPVALVSGGSRGIGAETVLVLAECGYDIVFTYHNKALRAQKVLATLAQRGVHGLALPCDLTCSEDVERVFLHIRQWTEHLDALVLNASGGLEQDRAAIDPDYATRINCDAQLAFVGAALPLLQCGSTIIFVTSHWAHLYGQIRQVPVYEPVARSKYAGELALRAQQEDFDARGIRFVVVTGDLIEGTVTPRLLERTTPDIIEKRRAKLGSLPTAAEMGRAIGLTAVNTSLATGTTVVVGEALQSLLSQWACQCDPDGKIRRTI